MLLHYQLADGVTGTVPLADRLSLGRGADNDLVISGDRVHDHHARIERRGGDFVLEHLAGGSDTLFDRDGVVTRVAEAVALRSGDVIHIGESRLTVASEDEPGAAAPEVTSIPDVTRIARLEAPQFSVPRLDELAVDESEAPAWTTVVLLLASATAAVAAVALSILAAEVG